MEIKADDAASDSEYSDFENTDESFDPNESGRKYSFVWKYFRQIKNSKSYECIICNGCVGHQTSNLGRHLSFTHNIRNHVDAIKTTGGKRGRPSKSFIWKFCTKQDEKHALCNLCNKILYFGGGNTENIAKHLRRKHSSCIESDICASRENMSESMEAALEASEITSANADHSNTSDLNVKRDKNNYDANTRKERKGGSYVWNYCDKLSRHTIRCNLCNKVMSFHGTANVITHLQRKHNIVGKLDGELPSENTVPDLSFGESEALNQHLADHKIRQYKRSPSTASVVWKYCKRVGRDVVRCGFCKKNLSYQGTSNLQRHLHRMHGVVTQGRISKDSDPDDIRWKKFNSNSIWEHCSLIDGDDEKTKCNLCNGVFDSKDIDAISKHLGGTHGIAPKTSSRKKRRRRSFSDDDTSSYENEDFNNEWDKNDYSNDDYDTNIMEVTNNIKKDESFFNDIIEEDPEHTKFDEEPFDPNTLHELPLANPLSPHSSRRSSPIPEYKPSFNNSNNKRLQSLNEEKIRVETEYFREKAGYYRMQKYLTALQAKKTRLELEQLPNAALNGSTVVNGEYITNMPTIGGIPTI